MNPLDIEHDLIAHEDSLTDLTKEVVALQPLRESVQEIALAVKLLREIYVAQIGAFSSPTFAQITALLDSATKKAQRSS